MKDILFTFFNYFVFFYTSMLAISFIVFAFLSFISLKRRKDYYVESYVRKIIKESPYTPGVSVIAPPTTKKRLLSIMLTRCLPSNIQFSKLLS